MSSIAFTKKTGWIIFIVLLFFDAVSTTIIGREGNPIWQPLTERYGIGIVLLLALLVLPIFYGAVEFLGYIVKKVDKYQNGVEVVLTNLVIVYAIYDLYFILAALKFPYMNVIFKSPLNLVVGLLVPGIIPYNIFLEYQKRKEKIGL